MNAPKIGSRVRFVFVCACVCFFEYCTKTCFPSLVIVAIVAFVVICYVQSELCSVSFPFIVLGLLIESGFMCDSF